MKCFSQKLDLINKVYGSTGVFKNDLILGLVENHLSVLIKKYIYFQNIITIILSKLDESCSRDQSEILRPDLSS